MQYFGLIGFVFALLAYSEAQALKKRVAALEAAKPTEPGA
jgi:hypothetical protein